MDVNTDLIQIFLQRFDESFVGTSHNIKLLWVIKMRQTNLIQKKLNAIKIVLLKHRHIRPPAITCRIFTHYVSSSIRVLPGHIPFLCKTICHYRQQMKLREVNVFTPVCDSVHTGGVRWGCVS